MDKVAALTTLTAGKKKSLDDLKGFYQDGILDEIEYKKLVEDVHVDFERKKADALKTLESARSEFIADTPVSAMKNAFIVIADDEKPTKCDVKHEGNEFLFPSFPGWCKSYEWPGQIMNWLKGRFPIHIFTILMALETVNFASDCFQLATVVETQQGYSKYPFNFNTYKEHTVVWRIVRDPLKGNLLGFVLPWDGNIFGTAYYDNSVDTYCFDIANIKESSYGFWIYSSKLVVSKPVDRSSDVCIQYSQVFPRSLTDGYSAPNGGLLLACPNNITGVYDEKSYVRITSGTESTSIKWYKDEPLGNSIYSLYSPNW